MPATEGLGLELFPKLFQVNRRRTHLYLEVYFPLSLLLHYGGRILLHYGSREVQDS